MKRYISFFLFSLLLLQGCVVYQKTPVSLSEAENMRRTKVIAKNGKTIIFENIIAEDSSYYGILNDKRIPLAPNRITSIYIRDSVNQKLNKNAIYGTFGTIIIFGAYNVNYERMLFSGKQKQSSLWGKVGYGRYYLMMGGGLQYANANITLLHRRNNKFLEVSIGYMYSYESSNPRKSYWTDDFYSNFINGSIGYRYQKPDGNTIYRFGAGYPETIYFSLGFIFGK